MKPLDLERFEGATAGPWSVPHFAQSDHSCKCGFVFSEKVPVSICKVYRTEIEAEGPISETEAKANAELIAAAPQLLAELKALRAWRETVKDAQKELQRDAPEHCRTGYAWQKFIAAYNAAETELHDGKF
jgi:hypothetical protein